MIFWIYHIEWREGQTLYEEGLLGETFFEYETREFGYTREDIEWFIEEYRAFEEKNDIGW